MPTAATPPSAEATVAIRLAVSHCETANTHPKMATTAHVTIATTRLIVIPHHCPIWYAAEHFE